MKIVLLLLASVFFRSSVASATELLLDDKTIYEATFDACSRLSEEKLRKHDLDFDKINAGIFPSPKFNTLLSSISRESFQKAASSFQYRQESDALTIILNNPGFERALSQCYGSSSYPRYIFTRAASRFDRNGKLIAGAATVLVFRGVGGVLAKISQWSKTATTAIGGSMLAYYISDLYQDVRQGIHLRKAQMNACKEKGYDGLSGSCLVDGFKKGLESSADFEQDAQIAKRILDKKLNDEMSAIESRIQSTTDQHEKQRLESLLRDYQNLFAAHSEIKAPSSAAK